MPSKTTHDDDKGNDQVIEYGSENNDYDKCTIFSVPKTQ